MYSKEELKQMDNDVKVKKFFKLIYREFDEENEFIRVFQNNTTRTEESTENKTKYFNDIDGLVNYVISTTKYNKNTYFELATTNGNSGQTEDLMYRYCLGFDFDKKDLSEDFDHIDILNLFKNVPLHFHALVDSGNGYHVYVCINKTNNLEMVDKVQRAICEKISADYNAIKKTQLLRVPYTYNIKDEKVKLIKIIAMDNREEIKPYDIEFLYDKNCKSISSISEKKRNFILNNTNIPQCILDILKNGSNEGERNSDLQKIIVLLRQRNKSFEDIKIICQQWAEKSDFNDNLDYRVKYIYDNLKYISMKCKDCNKKKECYEYIESEFDFDKLVDENGEIYNTYILEDKITRRIRNKQNGSDNMLNGNEILILNVLRNEWEHPRPLTKDGMSFELLMKSITCKKKSCLSERTVRDVLKSLVHKKFILEENGIKNKKFYKFNPIKTTLDKSIKVSYMATIMCIAGNITTNELGLYILMRQLHKQQLLENKTKGNIFILSQSDIAKKYYGNNATENKSNISNMIKNLLEYHLLDIYDIGVSRNTGFEYYKYRLNS